MLNGDVSGWRVIGNSDRQRQQHRHRRDRLRAHRAAQRPRAQRPDRARPVIGGRHQGQSRVSREWGQLPLRRGDLRRRRRRHRDRAQLVTRSNLGIELASERGAADVGRAGAQQRHPGQRRPGMPIGGYDPRRGKTKRVQVVNNTIVSSDRLRTGQGELVLNYRVADSVFLNNIDRGRDPGSARRQSLPGQHRQPLRRERVVREPAGRAGRGGRAPCVRSPPGSAPRAATRPDASPIPCSAATGDRGPGPRRSARAWRRNSPARGRPGRAARPGAAIDAGTSRRASEAAAARVPAPRPERSATDSSADRGDDGEDEAEDVQLHDVAGVDEVGDAAADHRADDAEHEGPQKGRSSGGRGG